MGCVDTRPANQPAFSGISVWQKPLCLPELNLERSWGGLLPAPFIIHQLKKDPVQFLPSAARRRRSLFVFICSHETRGRRGEKPKTRRSLALYSAGCRLSWLNQWQMLLFIQFDVCEAVVNSDKPKGTDVFVCWSSLMSIGAKIRFKHHWQALMCYLSFNSRPEPKLQHRTTILRQYRTILLIYRVWTRVKHSKLLFKLFN